MTRKRLARLQALLTGPASSAGCPCSHLLGQNRLALVAISQQLPAPCCRTLSWCQRAVHSNSAHARSGFSGAAEQRSHTSSNVGLRWWVPAQHSGPCALWRRCPASFGPAAALQRLEEHLRTRRSPSSIAASRKACAAATAAATSNASSACRPLFLLPWLLPPPAEGGVYYSDQQFVSAGASDESQLPSRAAALAKFGEFIRTFQVRQRGRMLRGRRALRSSRSQPDAQQGAVEVQQCSNCTVCCCFKVAGPSYPFLRGCS